MEEDPNYTVRDIDELEGPKVRRRKLLPWWIKAFSWFFILTGALVPVGIVIALLGYDFDIELYGIKTNDPISLAGGFVALLFLIKGITAFGLWYEKSWAVDLAIIDAVIGLLACGIPMLVTPFLDTSDGLVFKVRLEPILLIYYLIKLRKIKPLWEDEQAPADGAVRLP